MSNTSTNPDRFSELIELFVTKAVKYYDITISILALILLLIDSFLINSLPDSFLNLVIFIGIIIVISLIFDVNLISTIFLMNKFFNHHTKFLIGNFLKSIVYILILIQIIIKPLEVPLTFIIPSFASIDFYFLLLICLLTGLYFSVYNVIKQIFVKNEMMDLDI